MATNFPTSTDSFTTRATGDTIEASHVNNLQDATAALQAKVGVDSSAVTTSHDYKLGEVTSTDKAVGKTATQTLTNKTLTSPVITSPTLNLGSDAEGDTYYRNSSGALVRLPRGTDNYILKMNGNVPNWEAETAVVDASSTVKGIVEVATSSEITAGTPTGGTGAALAITPDQLALSSPTFDGSNLTGTRKKLNITAAPITNIANTTTETDLFTYTLSGGVLGTSNGVYVRGFFEHQQTSGGNVTYTLRLYYGTTVIATTNIVTATGTTGAYKLEGYILANASTSAQRGDIFISGVTSGGAVLTNVGDGTASEDSTASKTVKITVQMSSSSNSNCDFANRVVERIA